MTEFAARLGVSAMTVRRDLRALADDGRLERVHGGALSPEPSRTGRSERTIGMLTPSASYYYPRVFRAARDAAARQGCRLVLSVSDYDPARERRQVEQLIERGVDGLILTPHLVDGLAVLPHAAVEAGLPVVVLERALDPLLSPHIDGVRTDHASGARMAARFLRARGHTSILLATREDAPTAPWLRRGFMDAAQELGIDQRIATLARIGQGVHPGSVAAALDECLASGSRALIVLTDVDAISLEELALARGLRIPEDLSIVAYDDEVAELAPVPLTAVSPAKRLLGERSVELCLARMADPALPVTHELVLPKLVERSSTP